MASIERSNIGFQFGWYLIVGGTCTVVDVGGFVVLTALAVPIVIASPTSFLLGTVVNYFLSYWLAFTRGRYGRAGEIGRLLFVAAIGLGLNSLFVWAFIKLGIAPSLAKTIAIPPVLIWNFLARRWIVFHKQMPDTTFNLSNKVADQLAGSTDHSSK